MYEQEAPKRKRRWLVASSLAAVVLVVMLGVIGALADDDGSPTTAAATATVGPQRTVPSGTATPRPTATASSPQPAPTAAAATKATTKPPKIIYAKLTGRKWLQIAKNPDRYAGKSYLVYGRITQFDSATGDDTFRADVGGVRKYPSYGFVDYDTNTMLTGTATKLSDFVEDDLFSAKAVVVGSYEYETSFGGSTTVPLLLIKSIKNLGSVK